MLRKRYLPVLAAALLLPTVMFAADFHCRLPIQIRGARAKPAEQTGA